MGTSFFIPSVVPAFVPEQKSHKTKAAFLERSTGSEKKERIGEDPNEEQEAIKRFLAGRWSELMRVRLWEVAIGRGQWFKGWVSEGVTGLW